MIRAGAWIGIGGSVLDMGRWAAAFPHVRETGKIPLWLWTATPFGPGLTNAIVPFEHGNWARAYRASNTIGTIMSAVHALIAVPNLAAGFKQGWDESDGGPVDQALHGVLGLVTTRPGRTGLVGAVGPSITAGIILSAGWSARSSGLRAVLRAGQESPLRGSMKLALLGVALSPFMFLNESGALDFLNTTRAPDDHRGIGEVFTDALPALPETIRSLSMPYVPQRWVPQGTN